MIETVDNKKVLRIFERFEINTNLLKHVRKTLPKVEKIFLADEIENSSKNAIGPTVQIDPDSTTSFNNLIFNSSGVSGNGTIVFGTPQIDENFGEKSNFSFSNFIKKVINKIQNKKKYDLIKLQQFFQKIPLNNLESALPIIKYYEDSITHAEKIGQVSLRERLLKNLNVVRAEITLIDNNLTKFVSEEQLVDLYQQSNLNQNLKLTWIKNFVKIIPTNVLEIKEKVDALEIFDNYVILHYDPNNDATSLTEDEVRLKKDPIMFGVFKESRKLYYIADWIDEYCDLTLEKMFNILGEKVLEINNDSVKSFINDNRNNIPRQKIEETKITA